MFNLNTYQIFATEAITVDVVTMTAGIIEGDEADQYQRLRI